MKISTVKKKYYRMISNGTNNVHEESHRAKGMGTVHWTKCLVLLYRNGIVLFKIYVKQNATSHPSFFHLWIWHMGKDCSRPGSSIRWREVCKIHLGLN